MHRLFSPWSLIQSLLLQSFVYCLPTPTLSSNTSSYKTLVTLGDSYTDNCNTIRSKVLGDGFPNCPPAPLGRWDGGYSWAELLNYTIDDLSLYDYAYAGATCNNSIVTRGQTMDIVAQIEALQTQIDNYDLNQTLVTFFIGTNDIVVLSDQAEDSKTNISAVTDCVNEQLRRLVDLGFQHILLMEDITLQYTRLLGGSKAAATEQMVLEKNDLERTIVESIRKDHPTVDLQLFPTYDLFSNLVTATEQYFGTAAKNVSLLCSEEVPHNSSEALTCDGYVFWDKLHPSQASWSAMIPELLPYMSLP